MIIVISLAVLSAVLLLLWHRFSYWDRKGVKYEKSYSILGTISENVLQRKSMAYILDSIYKRFSNEPYFGIFTFLKPTLVITDPQLLKQIGIKDYDVFLTHKLFSSNDPAQAISKGLFLSTGPMWKRVRPSLSPAFTLNKLKGMFNLIDQCAKQFIDSVSDNQEDIITVKNMKEDIMVRFTNDVIANCIFGLESNSFKDRHNEFLTRNVKMSDFGGRRVVSMFGYCFNWFIVKLFGLSIIPKDDAEFFSKVVLQTIQMRKTMGIVRPDMVHLLMQAQQGRLTREKGDEDLAISPDDIEEITDLDIAGHSILFVVAGSDTSATALNFMAYELATNPDVQRKLYKEIKEVSNGNFDYDNIQKMKYLENVISETLRLWPSLPLTDRVSNQAYTFNLPGRAPLRIEKGTVVWIPIYSIHRDPKYYPEPEKFIPERFSEENKGKINKDTYMPFGIGPRSCIGSRLAMLAIKMMMVQLLFNFEIVPLEKTPSPLKLSRKHLLLHPDPPVSVGLKRRKQ